MAVALAGDGQITYASFPIEKSEVNEDGDLVVYGKATDGSIDADQQIVKPSFAFEAIKQWQQTGANIRVQHNPQRDPAGRGIAVEHDGNATWVRSLVVEPVAQRLVAKGVLTAYSVGIAHPVIERDISGKARGGVITGGQIVEISLVDRPANKSCGIQLVKSDGGRHVELMNKVFGDQDVLAKVAGGLIKDGLPDVIPVDVRQPDMSVSFTPDDLMKIMQSKIVDRHYDELAATAIAVAEAPVYKRDIDTGTRRQLAAEGKALPDGSYPIQDAGDLHNAAVLARSGHGNADAASRLIARRARELGVPNPMDDSNSKQNGSGVTDAVTPGVVKDDMAAEEVTPDVTKDEETAAKAKKPKKGKKLPPWLQQPEGDEDGRGGEGNSSCKQEHVHSEKCATDPKTASGASEAAGMDPMPHPDALQESPMPAGRKTPDTKSADPEQAAMLRFKSIGIDPDLGVLHDLTCPAYSPDDTAKYHPVSSFGTAIDLDVWMRKAVDAACGPLEKAYDFSQAWQSAQVLKEADPAELNDYRLEMHKAFRDANPGPSSYPSPGSMSPRKFNRPVITAGHAANSPGYGPPNSGPDVAATAPNAHSFDRPPLSAGHQSPSPGFLKGDWEYPGEQGTPVHLSYAYIEKERQRQALAQMHDHLSHQFPMACPMLASDPHQQAAQAPVPAVAGKAQEQPGAVKQEDGAGPEAVLTKGRKKMLKKLGKKVMAGQLSLDEARAKVGNRMSRKAGDEAAEMVSKEAAPETAKGEVITLTQLPALDAEIIKSAVASAIAPLTDVIQAQKTRIDEQQKVLEAIADQPDPLTAAFTGIAMNPVRKSARPAAVATIAENAERTQQMIKRRLMHTARTSEDPFEREAAWSELDKFQS